MIRTVGKQLECPLERVLRVHVEHLQPLGNDRPLFVRLEAVLEPLEPRCNRLGDQLNLKILLEQTSPPPQMRHDLDPFVLQATSSTTQSAGPGIVQPTRHDQLILGGVVLFRGAWKKISLSYQRNIPTTTTKNVNKNTYAVVASWHETGRPGIGHFRGGAECLDVGEPAQHRFGITAEENQLENGKTLHGKTGLLHLSSW